MVIQGLLETLGSEGTLLMPSLTFKSVTRRNPIFDVRSAPSCVGTITEYFRLRAGTMRSVHPTHSVCAVGNLASIFIRTHLQDSTPCGPNSPFHKLPEFKGQILMLGCGLKPNTSMHAIEELVVPPYLFNPPITYTLIDRNGRVLKKNYSIHNFVGWLQRYDRVSEVLAEPALSSGIVASAESYLIEAKDLRERVVSKMERDPLYFVDKI
jgi:aminoglycoside 3-N-acetyltransferase